MVRRCFRLRACFSFQGFPFDAFLLQGPLDVLRSPFSHFVFLGCFFSPRLSSGPFQTSLSFFSLRPPFFVCFANYFLVVLHDCVVVPMFPDPSCLFVSSPGPARPFSSCFGLPSSFSPQRMSWFFISPYRFQARLFSPPRSLFVGFFRLTLHLRLGLYASPFPPSRAVVSPFLAHSSLSGLFFLLHVGARPSGGFHLLGIRIPTSSSCIFCRAVVLVLDFSLDEESGA